MYSLIIVDDDELIRKGLEKVIPWEGMGLEVVSTFPSAVDALEYLRSEPVDVILTDVKMPGMTGLELVEEAKKLHPRCKAVIISGFSEFELVKNALTLKVEDYLLKPLSQGDIEKVFRKLVSELDAQRHPAADADTSFRTGYDMVTMLSREYELWNEYRPQTVNKLVLVSSGSSAELGQALCLVPHVSKGQYTAFIAPVEGYEAQIEAAREAIAGPYRMVVGSDVFWADDIVPSFWGAFGMLPEADEGRVSYHDDRKGDETLRLVHLERKILIDMIEGGNQEQAEEAVEEAIGKAGMLRPEEQGYVYCSIIYKLLVYFSMKDSIGEYQYGSINFSNAAPDELAARFREDFHRLTEMLSARSDSNSRLLISRTQRYVREHYGDPSLRLQQIADELQISYGYLSSIFTHIAGQSFKQFLIEVRMEEARKLLLSRRYRIYEIADKVGYSNPRYFNEAFRKYYGCSPVEYLRNLRSQEGAGS